MAASLPRPLPGLIKKNPKPCWPHRQLGKPPALVPPHHVRARACAGRPSGNHIFLITMFARESVRTTDTHACSLTPLMCCYPLCTFPAVLMSRRLALLRSPNRWLLADINKRRRSDKGSKETISATTGQKTQKSANDVSRRCYARGIQPSVAPTARRYVLNSRRRAPHGQKDHDRHRLLG
jgi:hypothetical protein